MLILFISNIKWSPIQLYEQKLPLSYCLMRFLFGLMVSLFGRCNCCITFLTPGDRGIVVVTGRSTWLSSWNMQHIQHNMLLAAESKRWSVPLKEQRNRRTVNEGRKMESVWLLKSQAIFVSIVRLVGIWRKTVVLSFQSANRKWHVVCHMSPVKLADRSYKTSSRGLNSFIYKCFYFISDVCKSVCRYYCC